MMNCARCGSSMYPNAVRCKCGWEADDPASYHENAHVSCSYMGCKSPSICKVSTKTGWANLCKAHYDHHFAREAEANLAKWGMERKPDETREEHVARMRKFVRSGFKGFSAASMAYAAQPGKKVV